VFLVDEDTNDLPGGVAPPEDACDPRWPNSADPLLVGSALDSLLDDIAVRSGAGEGEKGIPPVCFETHEEQQSSDCRSSEPLRDAGMALCPEPFEAEPRQERSPWKSIELSISDKDGVEDLFLSLPPLAISPTVGFSLVNEDRPPNPQPIQYPGWEPVSMSMSITEAVHGSLQPAGGTPAPASRPVEDEEPELTPSPELRCQEMPDPAWLSDFRTLEVLAASLPVSDDEDDAFPSGSMDVGEQFRWGQFFRPSMEMEEISIMDRETKERVGAKESEKPPQSEERKEANPVGENEGSKVAERPKTKEGLKESSTVKGDEGSKHIDEARKGKQRRERRRPTGTEAPKGSEELTTTKTLTETEKPKESEKPTGFEKAAEPREPNECEESTGKGKTEGKRKTKRGRKTDRERDKAKG
jgi:hypothetical protein